MKTAIIIPSRLGSTRLARKPLHQIAGVSLVERVYRGCQNAKNISELVVATDSGEIARHVESFGAHYIMTPVECSSGSERVAVAARSFSDDIEVVINVQGDEPLIDPVVIDALVDVFEKNPGIQIATPVTRLLDMQHLLNPNVVKVAITRDHRALYFSRSAIPFDRDGSNVVDYWQHIGVYGFRRKILQQISDLPSVALEEAEKLEQLRWLDAGYQVHCVEVNYESIAVDTEDDVRTVEAILHRRGESR